MPLKAPPFQLPPLKQARTLVEALELVKALVAVSEPVRPQSVAVPVWLTQAQLLPVVVPVW